MKSAAVGMFLILGLCFGTFLASGQEEQTLVPNLAGMGIPQAAAVLNRIGLALGDEVPVRARDAQTPNLIVGQSVDAGALVAPGTEVHVDVAREPNVRLVYDDNDLTLINLNDQVVDLADLTFESTGGSQASFAARRWSGQLRPRQCTQIWSITRNGPKDLPACQFIQNWLTTGNRTDHFWTSTSGAQSFRVIQDGIERAECDAAPPGSQDDPLRCAFYVPVGSESDATSHIYLAYTSDRLAVMNNSADRWMQVNSPRIVHTLAEPGPLGREFRINAALFGRPQIVARINRLAPGQCLLFASSEIDPAPAQDCDVIATLPLQPNELWWSAGFEVAGSDGKRRACAAPTAGSLTICVMPR